MTWTDRILSGAQVFVHGGGAALIGLKSLSKNFFLFSVFQMLKNGTKLPRKRFIYRLGIFLNYCIQRRARTPVIIVAKRRSGTNLLISYLNSVPSVTFWPPEPLNWNMYYGVRKNFISKRAVLRHLAYTVNNSPTEVCGFKVLFFRLKWHGITLENIRSRFPNVKFIILYRRSLFEQYLSFKIAMETDHWHWTGDFRLPERIRVDLDDFRNFCRDTKSFYHDVFRSPWIRNCSVVLSYEDLSWNPQQVFDRTLFPFLGLDSLQVSTLMKRQNTKPARELVENYREIEPFIGEQLVIEDAIPTGEDAGRGPVRKDIPVQLLD